MHFSTLAVDRKKAVVLKSWHKSNDRGKVFRKAGFREQGMGESLVPSDGRKNTPGYDNAGSSGQASFDDRDIALRQLSGSDAVLWFVSADKGTLPQDCLRQRLKRLFFVFADPVFL